MGDSLEAPGPRLRWAVDRVRRRAKVVLHWQGVFACLTASVLYLLLGVLVAPLLSRAGAPPWVYWAGLVGAAVGSYWWFARRALRRYRTAEQVALVIQREAPELGDAAINAVQLDAELHGETPFSRELMQRYVEQAAALTSWASSRVTLREVPVLRWMGAAGGALMVLAASFVLAPGFFGRRFALLTRGPAVVAPKASAPARLEVLDLDVTYHYPDYLARPPRRVPGSDGELRAVKGTMVDLAGRLSPPVHAVRPVLGGARRAEVEVSEGGVFRLSFPLLEEGSYFLEGRTASGVLLASEARTVRLEHDLEPTARITGLAPAPGEDGVVEVAEGGLLEIGYHCEDDHAVSEVVLEYHLDDSTRLETVALPDDVARRVRGAYEWALPAAGDGLPGELTFRIGARDNDNISGPKSGFSRTVTVRLVTDEVRHRELLAQLERLKRFMVRLLADKLTAPLNPAAPPEGGESERVVHRLLEGLRAVIGLQRMVLASMESDPLADALLYEALREMLTRREATLRALASALARVRARPQSGDGAGSPPADVRRVVQDGVGPLEEDIIRLDDLLQMDHLRGARRLAERLARAQDELAELLGRLQKEGLDREELDALRRKIAAMERMIDELAGRLAQSARRIEREFFNPDSANLVDWHKEFSEALERLRQKAEAGDLEGALAEAMRLQERLGRMMEGLETANSRLASARLGGQYDALRRLQHALRAIRDQQDALLRDTQALLEEIRQEALRQSGMELDAFLDLQLARAQQVKEHLEECARHLSSSQGLDEYRRLRRELQERIEEIERMPPGRAMAARRQAAGRELNALYGELQRFRWPAVARHVLSSLPMAADLTEELLGNLQRADLDGAQGSASSLVPVLKDAHRALESVDPSQPASRRAADAARTSEKILRDLADLRDRLKRASRELAGGSKGAPAEGLASRQGRAAESLRQAAETGGRSSGTGLLPLLGEAEQQMRGAESHLGRRELSEGIRGQQAALDALERAIGQAEQAVRQMMQNMQGRFAAMRRGTGPDDGRLGYLTAEVKVPGPSAYEVPAAFREEIQKALEQGLPDAYRQENQQYYQELVK